MQTVLSYVMSLILWFYVNTYYMTCVLVHECTYSERRVF